MYVSQMELDFEKDYHPSWADHARVFAFTQRYGEDCLDFLWPAICKMNLALRLMNTKLPK